MPASVQIPNPPAGLNPSFPTFTLRTSFLIPGIIHPVVLQINMEYKKVGRNFVFDPDELKAVKTKK